MLLIDEVVEFIESEIALRYTVAILTFYALLPLWRYGVAVFSMEDKLARRDAGGIWVAGLVGWSTGWLMLADEWAAIECKAVLWALYMCGAFWLLENMAPLWRKRTSQARAIWLRPIFKDTPKVLAIAFGGIALMHVASPRVTGPSSLIISDMILFAIWLYLFAKGVFVFRGFARWVMIYPLLLALAHFVGVYQWLMREIAE